MGKQPSAETQLRDLKRRFNEMQAKCLAAIRSSNENHRLLGDANTRLAACDAERRQLLDAMCAHAKREPAPINVTNSMSREPAPLCRWQVGLQKIQAIKGLRETSNLGLAEAKRMIEQGCGFLTAKQQQAIAPFVTFEVEEAP